MRQRVMIAMALVNDPALLIADEPTTALDVTTQAQILDLIRDLQHEHGTAVVLITHDLGVVAETADEVVVMYAARVAEQAPVYSLFEQPLHPYTWGLLGSLPRLDVAARAPDADRRPAAVAPAAAARAAASGRAARTRSTAAAASSRRRRPRASTPGTSTRASSPRSASCELARRVTVGELGLDAEAA